MGLKERYNKYLLKEHNKDYYYYNTFPIRFLRSQTNFKEIFQIFFNDGLILLALVYQLKLFYKIDLYYFFIPWIICYLVLFSKFLYFKIKFKGFYKSIFKCLECEKMTKITLDNCQHCDSTVHKNQIEYFKKKKEIIIKKRWNRINARDIEKKNKRELEIQT